MRDIQDFDELELRSAKAWRLSGAAVAQMLTGAIGLLAVGVLIGAYAAAAGHL